MECLRGRGVGLRCQSSHSLPQRVLIARTRQSRFRLTISAAVASRAAEAASAALSGGEDEASTSTFSVLQRYRMASQPSGENWGGYKYQHYPCASPVHPGDYRCLKIEALFQNVLGYPRLPPRVHRFLACNEQVTVESATLCVETLAARYGKELVFYILRRTPLVLEFPVEDLIDRAEGARRMLDLKPQDIYMLLRKNPFIMIMKTEDVRARFNKLHHVTPLSHEASRLMVVKYPLVLNRETETIASMIEKLRHLAYTRAMWQQDFDGISPSLLAFFLRDFRDLLHRLEFLAMTGESPMWPLYDVFKPSNNLFAKKHRGFRPWLSMRAARRRQLISRAQMASQRQAHDEAASEPSAW